LKRFGEEKGDDGVAVSWGRAPSSSSGERKPRDSDKAGKGGQKKVAGEKKLGGRFSKKLFIEKAEKPCSTKRRGFGGGSGSLRAVCRKKEVSAQPARKKRSYYVFDEVRCE